MEALQPRHGEPDEALAARVLARALDEQVDIRDLGARLWEIPGEATLAEVQIMAAYVVAKEA